MENNKIIGLKIDIDFTEPLTEEAVEEINDTILKYFKISGMTVKPKYGKEAENDSHVLEQEIKKWENPNEKE